MKWSVALLLAACGSSSNPAIDAAPAGPCWPLDAMPGGQAELGTGDIKFEPMPAMISFLRNGSQSDAFLQIHARIRGMEPGDPSNILAPGNPHTKVSAVIDELGLTLGVECPASLGYVAAPPGDGAGAYDLVHSLRIGLGTIAPDTVEGKQVRITLEVVSNGLSAQDEKTATLGPLDAGFVR